RPPLARRPGLANGGNPHGGESTRRCSSCRPLIRNRKHSNTLARLLGDPGICGIDSLVIGQDTIDRVREQANVVELVGETVKLTRRGRSFVGLCPFHKEKTPSFHVNEERGFYHCFGCGASGDGIKYLQETAGLSFIEAIRSLAERYGIPITETGSETERKQDQARRKQLQALYDVGVAAADFYVRMLREHPLSGYAHAELERRGLALDQNSEQATKTLEAFYVGYAPYGWD